MSEEIDGSHFYLRRKRNKRERERDRRGIERKREERRGGETLITAACVYVCVFVFVCSGMFCGKARRGGLLAPHPSSNPQM